jgi:cytochrome c biogenesis protein CcdA/thiol-disulfide isomerase/thioredoxin
MPVLLFVALLAGALSVLTPCVLPLLPALLAAGEGTRQRALAIVVGLVGTFTLSLLVLGQLVAALGLPDNVLRYASGALLVGFGLVVGITPLRERMELVASRLSSHMPRRKSRVDGGVGSGLLLGAGLGIVWAPCVGPLVAGIAASVASSAVGVEQIAQAVAFGLGMSVPLLVIVIGGQAAGSAIRRRVSFRTVHLVSAVVLVATGLYLLLGLDVRVNRYLAQNTSLTSTPIAGLERHAIDKQSGKTAGALSATSSAKLEDLGPAPEITTGGHWINSKPLSIKALRGKVVLVDFWTYSCINCLRTLPHIEALDKAYRDKGLVVIGVHTPEFQFEHDRGNVEQAVSHLGVRYPVVQDNDYNIWHAWKNQFWPAHYLIDQMGNVRAVHYGEGDYDGTEQLVRQLLNVPSSIPAVESGGKVPILARTPETYLGSARGARFALTEDGSVPDGSSTFPAFAVKPLLSSQWAYSGDWNVHGEQAVAGSKARLAISYDAADVFLVMGSTDGKTHQVDVHDGSAPARHVAVSDHRLYTLREGSVEQAQTMTLDVAGGVAVNSFTFG